MQNVRNRSCLTSLVTQVRQRTLFLLWLDRSNQWILCWSVLSDMVVSKVVGPKAKWKLLAVYTTRNLYNKKKYRLHFSVLSIKSNTSIVSAEKKSALEKSFFEPTWVEGSKTNQVFSSGTTVLFWWSERSRYKNWKKTGAIATKGST